MWVACLYFTEDVQEWQLRGEEGGWTEYVVSMGYPGEVQLGAGGM